MKLIVGLGNPGDKYAGNRHNIGFMAIEEIARGYSFGPWKKRFQGFAAEGQIGSEKCILLKPVTYMNESGRSAGEAMRFYKLSPGDVIAIHDELDLKPGMIRVKTGGGNAGHNGLKSISAHIGNEYVRVRLGIGHPGDKALVSNYVLQDFAKADRQWLDALLEGVARGMSRLVEGGGAAFLSEAARGRAGSAAAKLNGAAAPAVAKIEAPAPKEEAVPAAAAAALQADGHMRVAAIQVVAAREGSGGGAVSSARMLPEPQKPEPVAAEAVQKAEPAPQPIKAPEPAPAVAMRAEPAPVSKPVPQPIAAAAPAAPAKEVAAPAKQDGPASQPQAASAQKKKEGFFSRWFRARVRGGAMHS